ncbi:VapC toxin family PIN domain ribonuclease, partial [Methylobacterium radiotolerans]
MSVSEAIATSVSLARKHSLTVYDASYLELALATGATLATFDQKLCAA